MFNDSFKSFISHHKKVFVFIKIRFFKNHLKLFLIYFVIKQNLRINFIKNHFILVSKVSAYLLYLNLLTE